MRNTGCREVRGWCECCLLSDLAWRTCLELDYLSDFEISSSWCVWGYEQCVQEVEMGSVLPPVLHGQLIKVFYSWVLKEFNILILKLIAILFHWG